MTRKELREAVEARLASDRKAELYVGFDKLVASATITSINQFRDALAMLVECGYQADEVRVK